MPEFILPNFSLYDNGSDPWMFIPITNMQLILKGHSKYLNWQKLNTQNGYCSWNKQ